MNSHAVPLISGNSAKRIRTGHARGHQPICRRYRHGTKPEAGVTSAGRHRHSGQQRRWPAPRQLERLDVRISQSARRETCSPPIAMNQSAGAAMMDRGGAVLSNIPRNPYCGANGVWAQHPLWPRNPSDRLCRGYPASGRGKGVNINNLPCRAFTPRPAPMRWMGVVKQKGLSRWKRPAPGAHQHSRRALRKTRQENRGGCAFLCSTAPRYCGQNLLLDGRDKHDDVSLWV